MRRDGGGAAARLCFEDFTPGRVFDLGDGVLTEEEIVSFARVWDPQPMHVDPVAATSGQFEGLVASGWQTVCLWMRLYVDAVLSRAEMLAAPGVEELRWLAPVRPGMRLTARATVIDGWPSERHPTRGTIRFVGEFVDTDGQQVMTMRARGHARRRQEVDG
jgi:acyl dehydratase